MPSATTLGSLRPKMRQQLLRISRKKAPTMAATLDPDPRRDLHASNRSLRVAGAEILPGNRGRRAHQADRRPGDERKELRVADRIGRLGLGAVRQAIR